MTLTAILGAALVVSEAVSVVGALFGSSNLQGICGSVINFLKTLGAQQPPNT